jgi:hypothetical protein
MAAVKTALIGLLLSISCSLHAAGTNTNTLAIFTVRSVPQHALVGKVFDPKTVTLANIPVLADRDFVSYDRDSHSFSVTPEAARRMAVLINSNNNPRTLGDGRSAYVIETEQDQAFAFVAYGEIIYIGMFCNPLASVKSSVGIPEIYLLHTVPIESKDPVRFLIHRARGKLSSPSYTTWLSKAKAVIRGKPEDVRADRRIIDALTELGL